MSITQSEDGQIMVGIPADVIDTKTRIEMIARLALEIEPSEVAKLQNQYRQVDTLMPIFDPTGYMRILSHKGGHERLADAFAAFRAELGRITDGGKA